MSAIVEVHSVHSGDLNLNNKLLFSDATPENENDPVHIPVEAFYIYHPAKDLHIMWDLGLRKEGEFFPPALVKANALFNFKCPEDAGEVLARNGVDPKQVKYVFFSHVHFDHTGNVEKFPNATLVWGQGSQKAARPGYPLNEDSWFLEDTFPEDRTQELTDSDYTQSVGPFPRAHDYFGDGSFLLVDAPGHIGGHQVAIAKTKEGEILLGGDSCHHCTHLQDRNYDEGGRMGYAMHHEPELARQNLRNIETWLKGGENRKVAMAHFGKYTDFGVINAAEA